MNDHVSVTISVGEGSNQQVVVRRLKDSELCEICSQPSTLRAEVSALAVEALEQAMAEAGYPISS